MEIKEYVVKQNGLRSLLINLPESYGVSINVFVKSGSRHDPVGKEGLAHFIEHMIFKGSKNYPTTIKLATAIENLGGDTNASTGFDTTSYYIKIPSDQVKGAVEILSEIMRFPIFDKDELEKERMVIKEEIKMYEDDPQSDLFDNIFLPNLFKDTSLKVNPAGYIKTVDAIKQKDLFNFVEKNYISNNMVVVVAGKFDFHEIENLINEEFSWVKAGNATSIKDKFINPDNLKKEKDKSLQQSHILIGGLGYNYIDERKYALQLGNALLGSGFTSKLFTLLREQNGLSYYQGSMVSSLLDIGFYGIYAGVNKNNIDKAIKLIDQALDEIKRGKFSDDDLKRVKLTLESSLKKDIEGVDDFASFYGQEFIKTGNIKRVEEIVNIYNLVTKEEIMKSFNELFKESNRLICVIK